MESVAEFFVDPLVWPAYIYFIGYGVVWVIAFALARLFMSQKGMERAVMQAWSVALSMHILGGTFLIIWICFRAKDRVAEWFHIPLYLVLYIIIVIVDICLFMSLLNQRPKKETVSTPPQRMESPSRNPKKTQ